MANSEKNKQIKKRKVSKSEMNASCNQKENRPKSKKITIADLRNGIAMSKQLLLKKTKNLQNRRAISRDDTRICGNGIPLPPLAELEKMYDDSDEDEELGSISTPQENSTTTESPQIPILEVNDQLLSPTTIHIISERLMNIISDISDPNELLNQYVPPPPVIPQKKRKKPEEHYIVGCKERPRILNTPSNNFCKGDEEYGVDASNAEPDSPPCKRAKKSKIPSYSKSIFNAKCDEIAEKLTKNDDKTEETNYESSDSNKTIEYVPPKILIPNQPSFSPLPSTSRDSETFIRNDELFNQSLRENILRDETNSPQTAPNETINHISTIVIDDDEDDVEIIQTPQTGTNQESTTENSDDIFSSIHNNYNNITDHDAHIDITVIDGNTEDIIEIDVDDVIAQNQAILSKFKRNNELNATITTAAASTSTDNMITNNQDILNIENGNNVLNKTVTTPIQPDTNMNLTTPQLNPTSMPQATIPSSVNSDLNTSPGHPGDVIQSSLPSTSRCTHSKVKRIEKMVEDFCTYNHIAVPPQQINSNTAEGTKLSLRSLMKRIFTMANKLLLKQQKKDPETEDDDTSILPDAPRNIGECPICMDQFSSTNGIASTICGHVFCLRCIKAAIKVNGKRCPTCRKGLRCNGGYHQIFL